MPCRSNSDQADWQSFDNRARISQMSEPETTSPSVAVGGTEESTLSVGRMSFGDHLEELRIRAILALVGLFVGTALSLIFARQLLRIIFRPLLVVLDANGLRPAVTSLGIQDGFISYLKMGILAGVILSMPWIVYQIWLFVAAGLYKHEQKFVKLFGPVSAGLFALGVVFLYFVVLPIVLSFFVRFNQSLGVAELDRGSLTSALAMDEPAPTSQPEGKSDGSAEHVVLGSTRIPVLATPPENPAIGAVWVDAIQHKLRISTNAGLLSVHLDVGQGPGMVRSEVALSLYISMVLTLALAFGISFELPVAVVFLSMIGVATADQMGKARRYIAFGIFVLAAMLTPPDVISQVMLAVPMVALFEGGLLAARMIEHKHEEANSD